MEALISTLGNIAVTVVAFMSGAFAVLQVLKRLYAGIIWIKANLFDKLDNHEKRITKLEDKDHEAMVLESES